MKVEDKFVNELIWDVISKLTGSSKSCDRLVLPNYPQKLLILGSLSEEDPSFIDNESTSVKSNSLTVMFLTKEEIEINVKPNLDLFYGVQEDTSELEKYGLKRDDKIKIPFVWKRLKTNFPEFQLNKENNRLEFDFKDIIKQILEDEEHNLFYDKKKPLYGWKGIIELIIEPYEYQENTKLVKIRLINKTPKLTDDIKVKYDTSFFDCSLDIKIGDCKLIPFVDKRENDFGTIKEVKSIFKTFNCGWKFKDEKNNYIQTTPFKQFRQSRLKPKMDFDHNGGKIKPVFSELINSLEILEKLHIRLNEFLNEYKNDKLYNSDNDFRSITDGYESVVKRYKEGITCFESDENARKAFQLMHITFDRYSKDKGYDGWRIFQIVFIVSLIPDIINLNHNRRNEVDLLHVNTGGGKSEAYFGLVVFSAFYDRLIGKKFGTTAITKFPLRMLSVDQLQRIANLFIFAEEVRIEFINNKEDHPFSVAYFVGTSDEYPRKTITIIKEVKQNRKRGIITPGKIIKKCPLCNGSVLLDFNDYSKIIHRCENCKKEFDLFFTDEEIYRFLPTFIVCTVDKLAGVASQRRFRNILGGKLNLCSKNHGFIPRGDECEVEAEHESCSDEGERVEFGFSRAPSIIIQDEMHLIREGFGTIDSHFETFIETLSEDINGHIFKNITMTATVKGAQQQNKAIYWKPKTNIFPWYSPYGKGVNDPFYELENNTYQRTILGLKPNFRDNQYACLITLRYIAEYISRFESLIDDYVKKWNIDKEELQKIIEKYKCIMTYHNKKADVNSMNFYIYPVVNSKLVQLNYSINHKILTGDNTLEEIDKQIGEIKKFNTLENPEPNKLHALSCTSIVSHGVDILRWNIMCFQGIAGSTAEYIQALSRVGRKDTGVVFLWFYPNRVRDLSFYNCFTEFHEEMDLFVEAVPVERWTKLGFQQTFHSLFCGAILNFVPEKIGKPIFRLKHILDAFFSKQEDENNTKRKLLMNFLIAAYHVNEGMPNSNFMKGEIAQGVRDRLSYLRAYSENKSASELKEFFPNTLTKNDKQYWKTQFGMRGIQDTVCLVNYETGFVRRYKNE